MARRSGLGKGLSSLIPPGDYFVELEGRRPDGSLEPAGRYAFRVTG